MKIFHIGWVHSCGNEIFNGTKFALLLAPFNEDFYSSLYDYDHDDDDDGSEL